MALPFFRRLREIFESIAYAGLQPGARPGQTRRMKWLGPLSGPFDRLLSGGPAPSDPLYLTNRTVGQKVKVGLLVGVPCLVLGYVVYGMLTNSFNVGEPPKPKEVSPAEMAAKLLPKMDPNMRVAAHKDVEVLEVHVEHRGIKVRVSGRLNGAEIARSEWYLQGPASAAHAARRHRLRLLRSAHHLRRDRREGVVV